MDTTQVKNLLEIGLEPERKQAGERIVAELDKSREQRRSEAVINLRQFRQEKKQSRRERLYGPTLEMMQARWDQSGAE